MYYRIEDHRILDPVTKKSITQKVVIMQHEGDCPDADVAKKIREDYTVFTSFTKSITATQTLVKHIFDKNNQK